MIYLSDLFVGVFWGIDSRFEDEYRKKYLEFENFGKKLLGLNQDKEFKGTTIGKSNFKNGISSFNKNTLDIYNSFFDLIDSNVILHINLYSKTEFLITNYFKSIVFPTYLTVNKPAFIYSIIKFLFNYRKIDIFKKMFSNEELSTEDFLSELKHLIQEIISKIKNVQRKQFELPTLKEILILLNNSTIKSFSQEKFNWDYQITFNGFKLLLDEIKIDPNKINLTIDKEGTGKIKAIAKLQGFKKVKDLDSEDDPFIRVSDFLSNFLNRLSFALYESLKEEKFDDPNSFNFDNKHVLNNEWFDFKSEKSFLLYQKIHKILSQRKNIYWTIYTGVFSDYQIILFSLINYIGGEYADINSFKKYSPETHVERFNTYCAQSLLDLFSQFTSYKFFRV